MYDLLSLSVRCPNCNDSLMDKEHLVDNEPSICLNFESENKTGTIWLSSIYGSYNLISSIGMPPEGKITKFLCPHCNEQVVSVAECTSCKAPMVPFFLDMGGRVSICSRSGCKNHFVEFADLTDAMRRLYQNYGFRGKTYPSDAPLVKTKKKDQQTEEEHDKEIIESGTFIHGYCPHCKKGLIENEMLKLSITDVNNKKGFVQLSPFLNVFTSRSTIVLQEDQVVNEVACPHCNMSLIDEEMPCGKCESPVAKISVSAHTRLLDFFICTKKGCRWHGLSQEDYEDIRLEDSLEW